MADYKNTLNLPDTPFPMRGDLAKREPQLGQGVAGARALRSACARSPGAAALRAARRPAVRQRRHPHRPRGQQDPQGHHRQVEDAGRVRRALRAGLGLPRPADRGADREDSTASTCRPSETQRLCRAYATEQIERQKADFQPPRRARRLGQPLPDHGVPATRPTRSARSACCSQKGYLYRGLKPVNWCFDCGSALAEAEVEYEDEGSPAIDVGFVLVMRSATSSQRAFGLEAPPQEPVYARDLDHHAVDPARPTRRSTCIRTSSTRWCRRRAGAADPGRRAAERLPRALRPRGRDARRAARARRSKASRFGIRSTTAARRSYLGEYVTLDAGTGIVHTAPAYGVEDFESCRRYGMKDDEILTPVQGDGHFAPVAAAVRRHDDLGGQRRRSSQTLERQRERCSRSEDYVHSYLHCWRHKTPIIFRATGSGSSAWTRCRAGTARSRPRRCARRRCAASRRRSSSRPGARRACTA